MRMFGNKMSRCFFPFFCCKSRKIGGSQHNRIVGKYWIPSFPDVWGKGDELEVKQHDIASICKRGSQHSAGGSSWSHYVSTHLYEPETRALVTLLQAGLSTTQDSHSPILAAFSTLLSTSMWSTRPTYFFYPVIHFVLHPVHVLH
jgi:hypothetical protein